MTAETCDFRDLRSGRCTDAATVLVWQSDRPEEDLSDPLNADLWRGMCRAHGELKARYAAEFAAERTGPEVTIFRPIAWGRPSPAPHAAATL